MFKKLAAAFAFALLVFSAPAGLAGQTDAARCDSRAAVLDFLSAKYAEAPVAMGMAKDGGMIEILTSGAGATFTIVMTRPDGTACMVAAGKEWESTPNITPASQPGI